MTDPTHWLDLDYAIDIEGRILRVSEAWDRVARESGAPGLVASRVVGTRLEDHVSDHPSRHLWHELIERTRRDGRTRTVPIRCDTPSLRRWITVSLGPEEGGGIDFHTRLDRAESRPAVPLLDAARPRDPSRVVRMCGWCKRLAVPGAGWLEVEEAAGPLGLFEEEPVPEITHGLCEECEGRIGATV